MSTKRQELLARIQQINPPNRWHADETTGALVRDIHSTVSNPRHWTKLLKEIAAEILVANGLSTLVADARRDIQYKGWLAKRQAKNPFLAELRKYENKPKSAEYLNAHKKVGAFYAQVRAEYAALPVTTPDAAVVPIVARFLRTCERRANHMNRWDEEQRLRKIEQEKQLIRTRNRILDQITHAFLAKERNAAKFITCDHCHGVATHLGLSHDNPGSRSIAHEQITGATCVKCNRGAFKTTAFIQCAWLEFFYDGLKQLYINRPQGVTNA